MIIQLYQMVVNAKNHNKPGWQYLYKFNKVILNILYPVFQRNNHKTGIDETSQMIVSLTTFPDRINDVWISISSIMNQTRKAKKILLWLSKEQFSDDYQLPESLLKLQNRGLEIRMCEDDFMPHKKYFYAMQEYPNDIIVTIDDDIFYPGNHLEKLWEKHLEYPDAVCCWYAGKMRYDNSGKLLKYNDWQSDVSGEVEPTLQILPVGCGGVLYPPHALHEDAFNSDNFSKLCIKTDDLWLKAMEVKKNTKCVRCVEDSLIFYGLIKTRHKGLFKENADSDGNDVALRNILRAYPEVEESLYLDHLNQENA